MKKIPHKIHRFITDHPKSLSIFSLILLLIMVPLTILSGQQEQEIRQHASTIAAKITVDKTIVNPADTLTVSWNLASPTQASNLTPTPANSPIPTTETTISPSIFPTVLPTTPPTACNPRPTIIRQVSVDNVHKLITVTVTAGTNANKPSNTLQKIRFTQITNATLAVPDNWHLLKSTASQPIYQFPKDTKQVTFQEKRIACGSVTVEYVWIDDCGELKDFSGAGTRNTATEHGLTCDPTPIPPSGSQGYNLPSFQIVKKTYAQSYQLTGAETLQLYLSQPANGERLVIPSAAGPRLYLNCQPAEGTPPIEPIISGSCTYQIPPTAVTGKYFIRMLAADGHIPVAESSLFTVTDTSINTPTPANGISVTPTGPTPTGATGQGQITLNLTLTLTGIGKDENTTPKNTEKPITISLLDNLGQEKANGAATVSYDGNTGTFKKTITVNNVPQGTYIPKLAITKYLKKDTDIIITTGGNKNITTTLIVGDTNGDNSIDILDYNTIVNCFSEKANAASCSGRGTNGLSVKDLADLNDDGMVDGIDYNLFIRSLGIQKTTP